jgi:anti-anti-sigma regulatory factor
VVSVIGEVDVATAPALERTLRGVADDRTYQVIELTQFDQPFEIHPSLGAAGNGHGHG